MGPFKVRRFLNKFKSKPNFIKNVFFIEEGGKRFKVSFGKNGEIISPNFLKNQSVASANHIKQEFEKLKVIGGGKIVFSPFYVAEVGRRKFPRYSADKFVLELKTLDQHITSVESEVETFGKTVWLKNLGRNINIDELNNLKKFVFKQLNKKILAGDYLPEDIRVVVNQYFIDEKKH